jgi:hypothetical protein
VVHHTREAEGAEEETPVQALIPRINTVEDLPAHAKHLVISVQGGCHLCVIRFNKRTQSCLPARVIAVPPNSAREQGGAVRDAIPQPNSK